MATFKRNNKLNEELGISKEVQQESLRMINSINELLFHKELYRTYHLNDNSEPLVYGIYLYETVTLFGDFPVKLLLQIYFCKGDGYYADLSKKVKQPLRFSFNDKSDTMIIRFPVIRNEDFDFDIDDVQITKSTNPIYGTLSHEIKHAYQKAMVRRNTGRENIVSYRKKNVYDKAHDFLHSDRMKSNDMLSKLIFAVYYLYPQEITANIESLYTKTLRNNDNIKSALDFVIKSQMFKTIEVFENDLYTLKHNDVDKEIEDEIQLVLNRSIDWLIRHMEKGINFAYKKFRQLEKLLRKTYTH